MAGHPGGRAARVREARFLPKSANVPLQAYDFSPVMAVLRIFRPISQPQGFDFPPVTKKTRDKRFRGQKMKCEVNKNPSFIGKPGSTESMKTEIFHGSSRQIKTAKFKMEHGKRRRSSQRDDPTYEKGQNMARAGPCPDDKGA